MQSLELRFRKIYNDNFQDLFLYARAICKSEELAKDIVSEVFVNLWKSREELERVRNLKAYLLVSVKNECIKMHYKETARNGERENEHFINQIERVGPEEVLLGNELLRLIETTIDKLPDQCRLIFDLVKNQHKSYKEISQELGISTSTVSTQMGRAIQSIRRAIQDEYDQDSFEAFSNTAMTLLLVLFLV
ncbi:RNA polymerase sigma-70 factor [Marinoscillum sp. MHG1-6]|uniref:RNA polymerase sigma-70 factor n=1 Tax=Marinoscillum sp. MHG1-6 TaxID=2959627 RepID=UPI0021573D1C|nr:RNA polymerase sigma-70 factor [Marinoscillum sp. MHG1-6]